jgi:hypothetical protein
VKQESEMKKRAKNKGENAYSASKIRTKRVEKKSEESATLACL